VTTNIHPTAIVSPRAELGKECQIGPYCVVEDDVTLGDGCVLGAHVVVKRGSILGPRNELAENSVVGGKPQHAKLGAEFGRVRIGQGNQIREHATIHAAFKPGNETVVGDGNLIMVNVHVAHDAVIGNHVVLVNNVMIAGHVTIENRAYVGGAAGIHQFCRIGQLAMVGGQAHISQDVPPFVMVDGATTRIVGLNLVGLRRNGFSDEDRLQLKAAYRLIFRSGLRWSEITKLLVEQFPTGPAAAFLPFLSKGNRGFLHERRTPRSATLRIPDSSSQDPADAELRRFG